MLRTLLTVLLFGIFSDFHGQAYKFRRYQEQDGLINRFIYTVDQDEFGYLMVGTGEGLFRYDGFAFHEFTVDDGLGDSFITCSYKSTDGSIWYGHNKGIITIYRNNKFEKLDLSQYTQSRINQVFEDQDQNFWILTQNDGLIRMDKNRGLKQFNRGIEDLTLYSCCIDRWRRVWLGTDMGLLMANIEPDESITYSFVDEIMETKVSTILYSNNRILVGTEDAGVFEMQLGPTGYKSTTLMYEDQDFSGYIVNSIYEDRERNLWICTNNHGLLQLTALVEGQYRKMIRYQDYEGGKTPSMRLCHSDREGNMWIGTMGEGLIKLVDNYFSLFSYPSPNQEKEIYSIFERNDTIWAGGNSTVFVSASDPGNLVKSYSSADGIPEGTITSLFVDEKNNLWVGSAGAGLFKLAQGSKKFENIRLADEAINQRINDIMGYDNALYIATDFGIYQFDNEKLISHISVQSGLSHNVVKSLFRDSKGRIWIGTSNSQITYIEDGIIKSIESPMDDLLIQVRCATEDNAGNIWIGTDGFGIMRVTGDEVITYNKVSGLYSDYCYSLICDNRNKLWVGHHGAVSQVNLLNGKIEIIDPGNGFDIDFHDNAADKTPAGMLLFGVNYGVLRYEPDSDQKNEHEPVLHLDEVMVNDSLYLASEVMSLPYGNYKLVFDFIGISLKNPSRVTYQYMLEGYDTEWSDLTTTSVMVYNKLGPGEYEFKVRAYNSDGFGGITVKQVKVIIDKPFWLKWWFIASSVLAIALLARYIVLRRERMLRENQERLRQALDERTREVVEQKELLEVKNKDITDSIQYARHIQKAMLPPVDSLNEFFDDTFVYYKPRDIVSGDFYWVEKFENTIVVSCADCTGHGVPGAFMSLIGSTLLKEVSSKKAVQSSRDVLVHLDSELRRMLNKQGDMAIEDGMDIIVFDYHIPTKKIKMASANRPIIFYHKGEWLDLKGDRQSIGGSSITIHKDFNQYEFEVEKGDMIYLFSDGITDQFGGNDGKKLKRSGLLNWIKEVAHLDMAQQRQIIRDAFYQWKGEHNQLDDIILIGIKF